MNDKTDAELFAARMTLCAQKVGNAAKLARETGISRRAIGDYLAGEAEPSRPRLIAIAEAAGVEVSWLATGEGTPEREVQFVDFNRELFTDCWLAVSELLQGLDKELEAADLIKLVFAVYELQTLERAEGHTRMNMAKVIQLVRKVA